MCITSCRSKGNPLSWSGTLISALQNAAELFQLLLDMRVVAGNVAADFLHHVKEQAQVHGLVEQAFQGGGKAALDLEFVRLAQIFADHGKFLPEGVAHPLGVFLGFAAAFVEEWLLVWKSKY